MGYCYETGPGGRICCDNCGSAGGVRKRTCTYKVTGVSGHRLPYCAPPALCGACFEKAGRNKGVRGGCKEPAAASQAKHDRARARLAGGDAQNSSNWGDWHDLVTAGMVGMRFIDKSGVETYLLVPQAQYIALRENPDGAWLADAVKAEGVQAWTSPDLPRTKQVAVESVGTERASAVEV